MCMPHPDKPAAAANPFQSIAAASSLELGGQATPRGAAQMGRMALRFGDTGDSAKATPKPAPVADSASATTAAPTTGASATQTPNVPFAFSGLDGGFQKLRFGGDLSGIN